MPPSFWVYLLRCADGSYYARLPVELAWSQECPSRIEALNFERQIKGWGRAKKEALIRGDWAEVSRLAKSKGKT